MEIYVPDYKTAKINDFSLKSYLTEPIQESSRLAEIDSILKKKGGPEARKAYSFEHEAIDLLRLERIQNTYPAIDLSFLEKSLTISTKSHNGNKDVSFSIPKFAVFPFYGKENNVFSFSHGFKYFDYEDSGKRGYVTSVKFDNGLPKIFRENLANSIGQKELHEKNSKGHKTNWIPRPSNFREWSDLSKSLVSRKFSTEFNVLIENDSTINNLNNALNYFKKEELYLIAERKKEDWEVSRIQSGDPLIIGLHNSSKPFLIDIFDTTDLEKYVSDIHVQRSN